MGVEVGAGVGVDDQAQPGGPAAGPSPLSSAHISPQEVGPVVSWSVGGRAVGVKIPGQKGGLGGGARGVVEEFSKASQLRLLRLVNSFDQGRVDVGHFRFVTLTYPREFPAARASKKDLDTMLKRFERAWGHRGMIWKLEPQRRGAPHYHLLVLMGSQDTGMAELTWWAGNWCEVIGEPPHGDCWKVHMGAAGGNNKQCVEVVRDWGGVAAYCGKYLAKPCWAGEDWQAPGRWWGVRRRELLPVRIETVEVPKAAATLIRRTLVRWVRRQPTGMAWARNGCDGVLRGPRLKVPAKIAGEWEWSKLILRKWRRSTGGCNVFMAAVEFLRLCGWAFKLLGLDRCAIDAGPDPVPF